MTAKDLIITAQLTLIGIALCIIGERIDSVKASVQHIEEVCTKDNQ